MPPQQISFKASIHPQLEWTDHSPVMAPGDISAGHSPAPNSHCDRSSSFRRCTSNSSSSHHSSLHCPSADICSCHPSCCDTNRHSHTSSHTPHFSHRHHSCHSTDQSHCCSSNSHGTAQGSQPRKVEQFPRSSTPHKPHCSKTFII